MCGYTDPNVSITPWIDFRGVPVVSDTCHMSAKSSANWYNRKFDQPEMIQSMINRPEMLHVQYNPDWVFSIMLSIKIQFRFRQTFSRH